jgi:hypothetical protein
MDDLLATAELWRQLSQRLQELLGFNQPTPYLGFINGRHPRDWLMNHQPHDPVASPAGHD